MWRRPGPLRHWWIVIFSHDQCVKLKYELALRYTRLAYDTAIRAHVWSLEVQSGVHIYVHTLMGTSYAALIDHAEDEPALY